MLSQKAESSEERADRYALDFIMSHTKFEIDGVAHRELTKLFIRFESEVKESVFAIINAAKANEITIK